MQSIRTTTRRLPQLYRTNPTRTMAHCRTVPLFPQFAREFSPIIRILEDFDRAAQATPTFKPKFDVKELKDFYELSGELPGLDQKNVSIEWVDASTIAISGSTESRTESKGKAPVDKPAAESSSPAAEAELSDTASQHSYQKPSVTESNEDGDSWTNVEDPEEVAPAEASEVAKPTETTSTPTTAQPAAKYWVSERSHGQFRRTFTFPVRVEHEAVKASLKEGILNIIVPKAQIKGPKQVQIE